MSDIVVFQRVVPHYRLPIFKRLHEEFGWTIATSRSAPEYKKLIHDDYDFIKRFDIQFTNKDNPYEAKVPIGQIIEQTGAKAIIAEFGMRISSTYALPWIRRTRGKPIVFFWSHGFNMERGLYSLKEKMAQAPRVVLAKLVDGHLCYSEEGRDFLARYMPRDRLFVAPNTLDIDSLHVTARETAADTTAAPGRPHIIFVGRFTPDKEVPRLVRIFKAMKADFPDAALTIVGDGADNEKVRAEVGTELGRSIHMHGAVYDENAVAACYHSADLAIFAGAVGLSVNHALAYGVPFICFARTPEGPHHHPEIAYVVDNVTGYQVPTNTDEAMVQAVGTFLRQHPDPKADFAESIRGYVAEHLSLDGMIKEFGEVDAFIRAKLAAAR